jgi:hypothetical protein
MPGEASVENGVSSAAPERVIIFEEGMLGVTLKRSTAGRAVVKEINASTQARTNGVCLGDVVRQVGSPSALDLRTMELTRDSWHVLIDLLKSAKRPLQLVVSTGHPSEVVEKSKKPEAPKPDAAAAAPEPAQAAAPAAAAAASPAFKAEPAAAAPAAAPAAEQVSTGSKSPL